MTFAKRSAAAKKGWKLRHQKARDEREASEERAALREAIRLRDHPEMVDGQYVRASRMSEAHWIGQHMWSE